MKNPPHLPEELLIEIFSRLPGKSVGRFRCLSKSWRTNLSTSQFVKLHHSRGSTSHLIKSETNVVHTFNVDSTVVPRRLDFPAEIDQIGGYCNGFVLLCSGNWCFVVNPLTLEQVTIKIRPLYSDFGITTYGFGYDSCSDDYKIVKLSLGPTNGDPLEPGTLVDVYSMNKGSWNRKTDIPYFVPPISNGVFVNGAICWFAIHEPSEDPRLAIVAFDVASESFLDIPTPSDIPKPVINVTRQSKLFGNGGRLLMLCNWDIWMMKEDGQENLWAKPPKTIDFEPWYKVTPMFLVGGNEVALAREGSLMVWNIIDGTTKDLVVDGALDKVIDGVTYVESLVSLIQYQN